MIKPLTTPPATCAAYPVPIYASLAARNLCQSATCVLLMCAGRICSRPQLCVQRAHHHAAVHCPAAGPYQPAHLHPGPLWVPPLGGPAHLPHRLPGTEQGALCAYCHPCENPITQLCVCACVHACVCALCCAQARTVRCTSKACIKLACRVGSIGQCVQLTSHRVPEHVVCFAFMTLTDGDSVTTAD